jgi:hypothetical protein
MNCPVGNPNGYHTASLTICEAKKDENAKFSTESPRVAGGLATPRTSLEGDPSRVIERTGIGLQQAAIIDQQPVRAPPMCGTDPTLSLRRHLAVVTDVGEAAGLAGGQAPAQAALVAAGPVPVVDQGHDFPSIKSTMDIADHSFGTLNDPFAGEVVAAHRDKRPPGTGHASAEKAHCLRQVGGQVPSFVEQDQWLLKH